jgi:hypothetical protein
MNRPVVSPVRWACASLLGLFLGGCASLPVPWSNGNSGTGAFPATPSALPEGGPGRAAAIGAPSPAPAPTPGTPPPFAQVIKDARKIEGLFTLWQKDERLWIELKPGDFDKPFFLSPKLASGIGEPAVYGGWMAQGIGGGAGGPQLVEFTRLHNVVQMRARNAEYVARAGSPEALAVRAAFSPSLLGAALVASQPHPTEKSVLIDATNIFVSDMLGVGTLLQRAYRQGYSLDARNSAVTEVRAKPDLVVVEVQNHYAANTLSLGAAGAAPASLPRTLPDARSMFVRLHYSLSKLPDEPMAPRRADPRVGYFDTVVRDFGSDLARSPKLRYINRWRLEKKEPHAELSEPVRPITFWLDRTIPDAYRGAITAGVLEWNKAFERIGFKDAIVVRTQPEGADFDTLDADRASIRWLTNATTRFGAIGPTHVDPRSGEILDADIALESLSSRLVRALRSQVINGVASQGWPNLPHAVAAHAGKDAPAHEHDAAYCDYADQAAEQMTYALDVLNARGDLDPSSPEAQQFVLDYLKDTVMHEVGHTLGLRHNFRGSMAYSDSQLDDPQFTREHGTSASVMDYQPVNLPRPGVQGGTRFQTALGPYDYWAIEYGYKPLYPSEEPDKLLAIAARSGNDPKLAYGTDEDNYLGVDPQALHFDLGTNAMAFARRRFEIARDLLERQESRELQSSEDYAVLRRTVNFAIRDAARAAGILARQIGGLHTRRDYPGSGRDPLQPVSPDTQRSALDLLARGAFAADSWVVSPRLQRRLAPDYLERGDALGDGEGGIATDFSITETVLDVQRGLLTQLMSDAVAARILDGESKAESPDQAFRLSELYQRLTQEVWSELGQRDIPALRRELQREHINRVSAILLRPASLSRADARSLTRVEAQNLLKRINDTLKAGRHLSNEARAHLQDSAETLRLALAAPLLRAGT